MSLSDYLLAEIRDVAERPTLGELCERLHLRECVAPPQSAASAVRAERVARTLERQRHLLVARPAGKVATLRTSTVDRTRQDLARRRHDR